MSAPWLYGLLGVFCVHLIAFGFRYLRTRRFSDGVVGVTFLLLVISYSLRIWAPEWVISQMSVSTVVRRFAWGTAVLSVGLLIRRRALARSHREEGLGVTPPIDEEIEGGQQQE